MFFIYLQPKNKEALVIGVLLNFFCLLFETVSIGVFWPGEYSPHSMMFSAGGTSPILDGEDQH